MQIQLRFLAPLVALALLSLPGCVERRMKITTKPEGATVVVNDEEVGVSPVNFSFTWYGDYDIIIRKPGYQTLKTHYRIEAPWYQKPGIDFVTECLVPWTIVDEQVSPTFEMMEVENAPVKDLVQRADELRDRAIFSP